MSEPLPVALHDDPLAELAQRVRALATCTELSEVRAIRDVAVAAKEYARAKGLGEEAEGYAQEIVNRALRRIGELLAETPKAPSGWTARQSSSSGKEPEDSPPSQSSRGDQWVTPDAGRRHCRERSRR